MGLDNFQCDRCGVRATALIMSKFNLDMLCGECETKEREHPKYRHACEAEEAAVRRGDYNFPGVGKPSDL